MGLKHIVVQISGKQGSGKTTTMNALRTKLQDNGICVEEHTYAKVLYRMHDLVLEVMARFNTVPKKDGKLLQLLGTEWGREVYGQDVWVDVVRKNIEQIKTVMGTGMHYHNGKMEQIFGKAVVHIISDLRFPNEALAFSDAILVRLECPEEIRKQRILATPGQSWREGVHASEIALDDFKDWSATIDTTIYSAKQIANYVFECVQTKLETK